MKRWIAIVLVFTAALATAFVGIRNENIREAEKAALLAEQERLLQQARADCINVVCTSFADMLDKATEKAEEVIEENKNKSSQRGPVGVDLAYWQSQNSSIVGYLYSPGTVISYPVIHGTDNFFYLDHDIYGNPDINGCIMLECLNASDFSDNNSIIYGHHMKAGTMLASIDRYKNAAYYSGHSYMYLYAPGQTYRLDLIAGYSCPHDDEVFATGLTDDQIARFKAKSTFTTNLTDTSGPYVTLCTCSYEHENWRYVVICKKTAI